MVEHREVSDMASGAEAEASHLETKVQSRESELGLVESLHSESTPPYTSSRLLLARPYFVNLCKLHRQLGTNYPNI